MRATILASFIAVTAIAGAYAAAFLPGGAPAAAAFVLAFALAGLIMALLVLGARHGGRRTPAALTVVFAFTFAVLALGFSLALLAPPVDVAAPLWLGLPFGAAVVLYGIGLLPLLVLPIAYALTFDRATLSDDELTALRQRLARLRAQADQERAAGGPEE